MLVSHEQEKAKNLILHMIEDYAKKYMIPSIQYKDGDRINYAGRVFDAEEVKNLVNSSLEFWLTAGHYCEEFEKIFADYIGSKYCSIVNSGSSAVLVAFFALTSEELGERRIKRGDEVITVAAGFPTTVSPIVQYGAIPVFVDVSIPSYNIDTSLLENALSKKTKAVLLAHTLGNAFNLEDVLSFCRRHNLWLIEDNCDALGAEYKIDGIYHKTGTLGDIGCSSFYPAHHMTMGEGGAVYTNNPQLHHLINSFRDWGRDCSCPPGRDNCCGHRFDRQYGELPKGYDHKYVYSHFGFNLKVTDMQAAIGCAQLAKLPSFIEKRRAHWDILRKELADLDDVLFLPEIEKNSRPSWFGFAMTVRDNAKISRTQITSYLEKQNIQTRNLFSGNLLRHPCFDKMRTTGLGYRVIGELKYTDKIMQNTFWVGVYPGMTENMLSYMIKNIRKAVRES